MGLCSVDEAAVVPQPKRLAGPRGVCLEWRGLNAIPWLHWPRAGGPKTFLLVVDAATLSPSPPSFRSPLANESWVGTGDPKGFDI